MTELNSVRSVLELLPEPALLLEAGLVLWCNTAASRLAFAPGENAPALPEGITLPVGEDTVHWDLSRGGSCWEVTARALGEAHLLLLHPIAEDVDSDLLLAAARGIQPSLETIADVGNDLFAFLEEMENERIQAQTAAITRASYRLLRTAGELNAFARLRQEDVPLQRERGDLTAWFRALAEKTADALLDAGISLDYHGPATTVQGAIDREEVQHAVLHLISNAVQFAPAGSSVGLRVSRAGKLLRISVTGCAAPPNHALASVFSAYRDPGSTDPRQGMGLGLPMVQALARRHGGNLLLSCRENVTEALLSLDITQEDKKLDLPKKDLTGGYDPCLVVLSSVLPNGTYDSRSVDI